MMDGSFMEWRKYPVSRMGEDRDGDFVDVLEFI